MKKKSQIFMFDLIFSIIILVVTLGVIFSYSINTSTNDDIYSLNLQIIDAFTQTNINSLNNQQVREYFSDFDIRKLINIQNTVAQQVAQFHYLNRTDLAQELSNEFIQGYVRNGYSFNLTMTNTTDTIQLFSEQGVIGSDGLPIAFVDSSISSRNERSIIGYVNRTEIYKGYVVRLDIWI